MIDTILILSVLAVLYLGRGWFVRVKYGGKIRLALELLFVLLLIFNSLTLRLIAERTSCEILFGDERSECFQNKAVSTGDIAYCNRIENYLKNRCYIDVAQKSTDLKTCDNVNVLQYKEECYTYVSMNMGNLEGCSLIGDDKEKFYCYSSVAYATKNQSICELIEDEKTKAVCYSGARYKSTLNHSEGGGG